MKVSLELLYHFNCDVCQGWWSIGDLEYQPGRIVFCPHCGSQDHLPENPLLAADFSSQTHAD
jgi:hypothetical protein